MTDIMPNGALPDTRPPEARAKDYPADHLIAAGGPVTFQNPKPTALGATQYDQAFVSDCVPHGFYTQLEYEGIVPPSGMSQLRAYRKRVNFPNPGSDAVDLYSKIKAGQSVNAEAATHPGMTDAEANAMPLVAGSALIPDFKYYSFSDYSLVPLAVTGGKAVAIFIYATEDEWAQQYVTVKVPDLQISSAYIRHCVCIMPKGDFTENGQQWLAVQDSAGFAGLHLRYISFDFLLKRCYYASQVYKTGAAPKPVAFKYTFTKQLRFQSPSNNQAEVHAMQQALQALGYMTPGTFGPFGPQTRSALGRFQTDHGIKDADGQGTNFGPQSRAAMNAALAALA